MSIKIRQKKISNSKASIYLDIHLKGNRKKEYLKKHIYLQPKKQLEKTHNREVLEFAEKVRAKRLMDMENGLFGFGNGEKKYVNFIDYFSSLVKLRERSGVNYQTWKSVLRHVKLFAGNHLVFADVNDQWLNEIKIYFLQNLSSNSAHGYFNKLKAALYQAQRDRIIIDNPAQRIKAPKQIDTHREFLTVDELQAAASAECKHPVLKLAFLFSALTGLRWSDINKLHWEEVQYANEQGWYIRFNQQKTLHAETLPISEQARELLGVNGTFGDRVFKGLKYSAYMNVTLSKWMLTAGITKHITFHSARHTYATLQLTFGTDIYTVSKLLGHRDLKTTQIYAKVIDQKKVEAAQRIPHINL